MRTAWRVQAAGGTTGIRVTDRRRTAARQVRQIASKLRARGKLARQERRRRPGSGTLMVTGLLLDGRVRRAATGEDGVVLSVGDSPWCRSSPSGTVWNHPEELEKLPRARPSALQSVSSAI